MLSSVIGPLVWLVLAATAYAAWPHLASAAGLPPFDAVAAMGRHVVAAAIGLSLTVLAVRLLNALFWRGWMLRHVGEDAPRLLADLGNGLVWAVGLMAVTAYAFGIEVTGLVATSGVAVAVVGFALRGMISDVASGIAMSLEAPFRIGEWIEVDGIQGRVQQVTWRATYLLTRENVAVAVPNGKLAAGAFRRFGPDGLPSMELVEATLDYSVSAHQAERLFYTAAAQVPEVAACSAEHPPYMRVAGVNANGVVWRLFFPVVDWSAATRLRYEVQRNLLRNLHLAGAGLPAMRWQQVEPYEPAPATDPRRSASEFLRRIDLFGALDDQRAAGLATRGRIRIHPRGVPVVRQGEPGESLFVVREGVLSVSMLAEDGTSRTVAQLTPGSFFGEMSLLTGAPRSATIVPLVDAVLLEIGKELLEPLLCECPDIAQRMSECLAERQLAGANALSAELHAAGSQTRQEVARDLLSRITAFFGLRRQEREAV